jgi:hypothetical protein
MEEFSVKFGKQPRNPKDMHRPVSEHDCLDGAMCHKVQRTQSGSLTLRYDKVLFILEPSDLAISLARQKVTVCDYPDGRLEIRHKGICLPYRTFDKLQTVKRANVVENKRLDEVLSIISSMQADQQQKRSQSAPRRTGQTGHMFDL